MMVNDILTSEEGLPGPGFGEQGNISKILKGTREHKPIFREQGNKTVQIRGENIVI